MTIRGTGCTRGSGWGRSDEIDPDGGMIRGTVVLSDVTVYPGVLQGFTKGARSQDKVDPETHVPAKHSLPVIPPAEVSLFRMNEPEGIVEMVVHEGGECIPLVRGEEDLSGQGRIPGVPVFEVPLVFLSDPRNRQLRQSQLVSRDVGYYAFEYDHHTIWGATAAMLVNFLNKLEHMEAA